VLCHGEQVTETLRVRKACKRRNKNRVDDLAGDELNSLTEFSHGEGRASMSHEANKKLFRTFVGIWESGRIDELDDVIHPEYVGHPSAGDRDSAGLGERILAFRETFRDVRFEFGDQIADGDKVASRMTATAVRASDGKPVILYGHNISRFRDERLIEEWMVWEVQEVEN